MRKFHADLRKYAVLAPKNLRFYREIFHLAARYIQTFSLSPFTSRKVDLVFGHLHPRLKSDVSRRQIAWVALI